MNIIEDLKQIAYGDDNTLATATVFYARFGTSSKYPELANAASLDELLVELERVTGAKSFPSIPNEDNNVATVEVERGFRISVLRELIPLRMLEEGEPQTLTSLRKKWSQDLVEYRRADAARHEATRLFNTTEDPEHRKTMETQAKLSSEAYERARTTATEILARFGVTACSMPVWGNRDREEALAEKLKYLERDRKRAEENAAKQKADPSRGYREADVAALNAIRNPSTPSE